MQPKTLLLLTLLLSTPALADRAAALADAFADAKELRDEAEGTSTGCRKKVLPKAEDLVDRLKELKKAPDADGLTSAKKKAQALSELADDACKPADARRLNKPLGRVLASLESATEARPQAQESKGGVVDIAVNLAGGIGGLFGGASSETRSSSTRSGSSSRTETINGKPLDDDAPDAEETAALERPKKKKQEPSKGEFGATCRNNNECDNSTCFVGQGNLGYCTKMCNSWSDCPSHWNCQRAANAPQKICMQGS